eukprot:6249385-Amphidinium_carterae.1
MQETIFNRTAGTPSPPAILVRLVMARVDVDQCVDLNETSDIMMHEVAAAQLGPAACPALHHPTATSWSTHRAPLTDGLAA